MINATERDNQRPALMRHSAAYMPEPQKQREYVGHTRAPWKDFNRIPSRPPLLSWSLEDSVAIGTALVPLHRLRPVRTADSLKSIVDEHDLGPASDHCDGVNSRKGH